MTKAVQGVLASYEALPESDRREVLAELLRRSLREPYASPAEDELLLIADEVFQSLDRREASGERAASG